MTVFLAYNVSDDLATYITFALNANIGRYAEFMQNTMPKGMFQSMLDELEVQFQHLMKESQFDTIVDLHKALAVDCNE